MKHATTRVIIDTMIRKAIHDIKDSPKRGTRNMIDMALNFSDGRFQKHFFQSAQKMLKDEHSAYYTMALDAVNHIDAERLIGFGMNLGYNGCTIGAKRIREIEERDGYDIPWTIALMMDTKNYSLHEADYRSLVEQGKALGIYAWQLCVSGDPDVILPLIEANKDCAFTILCDPETVTEASRFSMYIDAQSIAYPCSFGLGKSEYCVDLKSSPLKDAWNSKQFARFREKQEHMCQGCNVHGCRSCALNLGLNLCGKL